MSMHIPAPRPLTALIGRQRDLEQLSRCLTSPEFPLVTVVGAGGIGKTRLALEVIDVVADDFDDGVLFLDLSATTDPSLLPEQLLLSLGDPLPDGRSVSEVLFERLESKALLIVLDNMEHLLDARDFLQQLLDQCPATVVLATSREQFGIPIERVVQIAPLATPDQHGLATIDIIASSEAVQLFLERARAVERDYALTEENASDVAAICRRLDGLPLAIELAAARVAEIPLRLILRNFTRILPFLERSPADPHGRHRTMRNAIEWSYLLLTEQEQRLFRHLSIFERGGTLASARAVTFDDVAESNDSASDAAMDAQLLGQLDSLVAKHFLIRQESADSEIRYTMLETLREFGRERLSLEGELAICSDRHAKYITERVQSVRQHVRGADPGRWLDRTNSELSDIRSAYRWLMNAEDPNRAEEALVIANRLDFFWEWRGHAREGDRMIAQAIERLGDRHTLETATGFLNRGNLESSDLDRTRYFYERSLAICREIDHPIGIAGLLLNLGMNAEQRGDSEQAHAYLQEGLRRFRNLGNRYGVALCENHLGIAAMNLGDLPRAKKHLDEARGLYEQLGDEASSAWAIVEMGKIYDLEGKPREAKELFTWCLARFTSAQIGQGICRCRSELGWLAIARNNLTTARNEFDLALRQSITSSEFDIHLASTLEGLAHIALDEGNPETTVVILAAVDRWRDHRKQYRPRDRVAAIEAITARARSLLGSEKYQAAWSSGNLMTIEDVASIALELPAPVTPVQAPDSLPLAAAISELTPREREVVCLIARGEKNQQIADRLYISNRTVAVHVQNILRKLEVENRTQASAIAFQSGLCAAG